MPGQWDAMERRPGEGDAERRGERMSQPVLTRRTFLAVAGLGTAALACGFDSLTSPGVTPPPTTSPFLSGPYFTNLAILGETPGTTAMAQPFQPGTLDLSSAPGPLPPSVSAAIYYPFVGTASAAPLHISQRGPFPVLLYAHAARPASDSSTTHPLDRDFTTAEEMLRHVASYGCVCVAPDLSWLPESVPQEDTFNERAVVLVNYYEYLDALNDSLFGKQLDLARVILVGHSTGAGGATHAGRILGGFGNHLRSLCYGLIAPESGGDSASDIHPLVVLGGTLDTNQSADPQRAYAAGGTPKTLVTIPGANHFGYTDLCTPDNHCAADDPHGTISNAAQQATGGAYLAAMVRCYALGDGTARPYLTGERTPEGLETLGVTGIQVQSAGFRPLPPLPTVGTHP
jgi:hypothetical protein